MATCLWRRALIACTENSRVLQPTFSRRLGVEMTVAQGLLNRLEKEGFIKNPSKGKSLHRLGKVVNKEKIMVEGIQKYFKKQKAASAQATNGQKKMETSSKPQVDPTEKEFEGSKKSVSVDKNKNEIDNLSQMTEGITLSGRKKKMATKAKKVNQSKIATEINEVRRSPRLIDGSMEKPVSQVQNDKRRGKKRAIAKCDVGAEFDLSNSQDVDYKSGRTRKRKASDAARAIMV